MGDHEGWAQPSGLLPGEVVNVTRPLDRERWAKAEERTADLIACIQPNRPSEERRNAVAEYVERLIHKCFTHCKVFTFGSVPLKTYLPDGDIDLTAFSNHQALKDTWANKVRDVLQSEEKSEHAEFHVKEVQYIQAEVKIIKCLVENIVVDISFNQLGGLCTLCFLEKVDDRIGQNHLFKRSIILVKAWCYYESRILGAHHGLISTYALETLVLYIFHVFNKSFSGPLEVLYRFLAFFSNFDWDNYCVSLWGPIPLSSLPHMTAEPPRKDGGELLLDKGFLQFCHTYFGVYPGGQDNQGQSFVSKHFNVVDPLRTSNNLGRSVSKGNFFRIRSAFGFGARTLARILECPKESIISEIDQFFMNTWERHGSGQRPDAASPDLWHLQPSRSDSIDSAPGSISLGTLNNDDEENTGKYSGQVKLISDQLSSLNVQGGAVKRVQGTSSLPPVLVPHSTEDSSFASSNDQEPLVNKGGISANSKSGGISEISRSMTNRYHDQLSISDQSSKHGTCENRNANKNQKGSKLDSLGGDFEEKGRFHFARPRSSPELRVVPNDISNRGRQNRGETTDASRNQVASARFDHGFIDRRRKNTGSDSSSSYTSKTTTVNESLDLRRNSSQENIATGSFSETANYSSNFSSANECQDASVDVQTEEVTQSDETMETPFHAPRNLQDIPRQQFVNRQPSPQFHLPMMAYGTANLSGGQRRSYPTLQFPSPVTSPMPPYIQNLGIGAHAHLEDMATSDKFGVSGSHHEEEEVHYDPNFLQKGEHDSQVGRVGGLDMRSKSARNFHFAQSANYEGPASPLAPSDPSSGQFLRGQHKFVKDVKGLPQEEQTDFPSPYNLSRLTDDNGVEPNQKVTTSSQEISPSRMVESTWTGGVGRVPKLTKDKRGRGRGTSNAEFPNPKQRESFTSSYGKSHNGWQGESTIDSTHVGDEIGNQDRHSFGAPNAVSLNYGDSFPSSLHGSRSALPISSALPHVQPSTLPGYDSGAALSSDSVIPGANLPPVIMAQGSQQRPIDNAGVLPFTFYPTGPPFPFLTMLPIYNIPPEGVSSGEASSQFDSVGSTDDSFDNHMDQPEQSLDSSSSYDLGESSEHSDIFPSSNMGAVDGSSMEHRDDMKSDILHSDLMSHWCNLEYGRSCQYPLFHSPMIYPSPMVIPPMYLQGHSPWDGPGRPLSNLNMFTLYGHRFVPVTSLQPNASRPGGNLQRFNGPNRFIEELPRHRGGTGTYLPNPRVPYRDRQSSGNRGNRVTYGQDRNDHGDRDASWVFMPKGRGTGRGQNKHDARNQNDKSSSRIERNSEGKGGERWDSYRHENLRRSSYQVQHAPPFASGNSSVNVGNFMQHGSGGMSYGMYPLQPMNTNGSVSGIPGNGPAVPSVVMLYPYDHNLALEFGSLGPVQFGGTQEGQFNDGTARLNDGCFYEQRHNSYQANSSPGHSPSGQPSSPKQHQRSSTQCSYQLKEEDFPPLSEQNQSGRGGSSSFNTGNSSNNRSSHYQTYLVTPSS